jgi:hypothetical protein
MTARPASDVARAQRGVCPERPVSGYSAVQEFCTANEARTRTCRRVANTACAHEHATKPITEPIRARAPVDHDRARRAAKCVEPAHNASRNLGRSIRAWSAEFCEACHTACHTRAYTVLQSRFVPCLSAASRGITQRPASPSHGPSAPYRTLPARISLSLTDYQSFPTAQLFPRYAHLP